MGQGTPAAAQHGLVGYATTRVDHSWVVVVRLAALAACIYGAVNLVYAATVIVLQVNWALGGGPVTLSALFDLLDPDYAVMSGGSHVLLDALVALGGAAMVAAGAIGWSLLPFGRPLMLATRTAMLLLVAASYAVRILLLAWDLASGQGLLSSGDTTEDVVSIALEVLDLIQNILVPALVLALLTRPAAREVFGR